MKLLPIWNTRTEAAQRQPVINKTSCSLKKSPRYYAMKSNFIETSDQAQAMLDFALQRPLSHIGFDTEFGYGRPGVIIDRRNTKYDPTSIQPLLLSLALAELPEDGDGYLYSFVIDLRKTEVLPTLNELFRLPMPFCGHFTKVELFCLWQLDLTEPLIIWDTFIFEKTLALGRHHHKYRLPKKADEAELAKTKEETKEKKLFGFSLVATCQRYGVAYRMETNKARLQQSFLNHPNNYRFSEEQIEYAAEDAIATAHLYPLQVNKSIQHGLLHHCETVEMAWVTTNARIEWAGVRVDQSKRDQAVTRIAVHTEKLKKYLDTEYGIHNTQSHKQLTEFFRGCGLLSNFIDNGKASFDKKNLKKNTELHPAIALLRAVRRGSDLLAEKLLSPDFTGTDGRIRAEHRQLGTDTGRQTSRWPNLLGLDRVLRPLVIPEDGYGIGEVDWSQVEVGVAAAMYGDDELVRMFNSGDVYSAMAQHFSRNELPLEDLNITGTEFKKKHKALRNQMKTCTLGLLYGITPVGLAQLLNTNKTQAATLQKRFMAMFPQLQVALNLASQSGGIRGYAYTISGLKRYRAKSGETTRWEKNWMTNHPVQGSAAVVFKAAGNRLDKLYRQYDTRIIIPVHDAFIFEAPLESLKTVAELTSRVMCNTLQEYFPILRPQVETNISKPECWNKDGDGDELEKWIQSLNNLMTVQKIGDKQA